MDDFDAWLKHGTARGWISEPVCYFHSLVPMSVEERQEFDDTGETSTCPTIVRVYGVPE
jgi:hypothetical protein